MIALIGTNKMAKLANIPQITFLHNDNAKEWNEAFFDQFQQILFVNYAITTYAEVIILKYAPEKVLKLTNIKDLERYLIQLKNIINT